MRVKIAVYDTATGRLLRVVTCPATAASKQSLTGEAVLEAAPEVRTDTHRVVNGEIVPL